MKHLKLFEGFEGSIIPSVIGFLNKKGVNTGNLFLEKLKGICDEFDIPLSKITNDNLKYLPSKKAIKIRPESKNNNNKFNNINCIKFWFSMDKYLGYTGVGYSDSLREFENSTNNYIKTIRYSLGIENGSIEKISSYSELNTGDDIILNIDGRISNAIFYNHRNTYFYAIQNYHNGSEPLNQDWKRYGRYSWELSRINYDYLFRYIRSEILLSIGNLIHEYCKKVELNNLYDYTSVCIKIKSTRAAFLDDQYRLSSEVRTIIENFYYSSDVCSYISNNRFMNGLASESVKDLYKLKAIYKHTKSMFT